MAVHAETASSSFEQGVEQFEAKRYHAAAKLFSQAETECPNSQPVHLFMGQTLEKLLDADGAKSEYEACFLINPFNQPGRRAKELLLDLSGKQAAKIHPAADTPETVEQTVRIIKRQTAEAKSRYRNWADMYARQRLWQGNYSASLWHQQANLALSDLRHNQYYGSGAQDEISSWGVIHSHYAVTDAQTQAYRARTWGTQAQANLQESANNLIRNINRRGAPDQPMLRAKGTNLYVRYYGGSEQDELAPEDPPLELKAVAKKLEITPRKGSKKAQTRR